MRIASGLIFCFAWIVVLAETAHCQDKMRARGLGIPLEGTPGQFNAITDVEGVEVGYATIIDDT